jgi:hypothetical protein
MMTALPSAKSPNADWRMKGEKEDQEELGEAEHAVSPGDG